MMYRYEVFKMDSSISGQGTLGIVIRKERDGLWPVIAAIGPFSNNMEEVSQLAEKCTNLQLSPIHMPDVVHDFVVAHPDL